MRHPLIAIVPDSFKGTLSAAEAAGAIAAGVPVIAICGCTGEGWQDVHQAGIAAVFAATTCRLDEDEIAAGAAARVIRCSEEVGRLLAIGGVVFPKP
jgi:glycerate kinase